MFTLDVVRRIPSVDTEPDAQAALHDRDHLAEIRRLVHDLHEADTAIQTGRIEDAHRALIRAQDVVFERHMALGAANHGRQPTDLFLHLTNRLIDANRFKDRAIIAECRSLLNLLADACVAGATAPVATLT